MSTNKLPNTTDEPTVEELKEELKETKATLKERTEQLRNMASEYKSKASEKWNELSDKASSQSKEFLHKANTTSLEDIESSVGNYVKENPGKSIAAAAVTGFVLGVLIRGSRD